MPTDPGQAPEKHRFYLDRSFEQAAWRRGQIAELAQGYHNRAGGPSVDSVSSVLW